MGKLRTDVLKIKDEFDRVKAGLKKYQIILNWSLYSGGALLFPVLGWILFPPEQHKWRWIANLCFTVLLLNLWVSYWLIHRVKWAQRVIGELRIKLLQLVWERACDCERPCDCALRIEKEIIEKAESWNDGIKAEVEQGNELS